MRMAVVRALLAAAISWVATGAAVGQSMEDAASKSKRANELVQAGKPEEAIAIYQELAASFPGEISFKLNLGIALYKAGRYQESLKECEALAKRRHDLFPAWLIVGASDLKLGDAAAAEEPLRQALAIQPEDPNAHIMLADALLALARWPDAAAQYEISARAMRDNPRVWFGLWHSYDAMVEECFARLRQAAPESAEEEAFSCELEIERGDLASAFQHCRKALSRRPSLRGIHAMVAKIYEGAGHADWARVETAKGQGDDETCSAPTLACKFTTGRFAEIAGEKADSPEDIYWQGKAFLALSQQAYRRVQELPPSRESYEATATEDEKRGLYPEAGAAWRQALQFEPTDRGLKHQLALALCHANDCVSALPLLKEELRHDPRSAELNYLCGLAFNSTRNPAEALPYLEAAVQLDAKFLPARAALGEAYLEAGMPERAIAQFEAAKAEDVDGSRHYQLSRAYLAAGMRDRAAATLEEYKEISRRAREERSQPAITPP